MSKREFDRLEVLTGVQAGRLRVASCLAALRQPPADAALVDDGDNQHPIRLFVVENHMPPVLVPARAGRKIIGLSAKARVWARSSKQRAMLCR